MGTGKTCIGTLVERSTRFVMLLKLERNTAEAVRVAMAKKICELPDELRRSVTWDSQNVGTGFFGCLDPNTDRREKISGGQLLRVA